MPEIDHYYIRLQYGSVIASTRLVLNGDTDCVVFKTWAQTSQFLTDPFTPLIPGRRISPPAPLCYRTKGESRSI